MRPSKIHINCDMGESFGRYLLVNDVQLLPYIDACNIACGFHAGDPIVIDEVVKAAVEAGKEVGAHPGYPDLQGFGRRQMQISPDDLYSLVKYQVAAIKGITESWGGHLTHVKAHGALYNHAAQDPPTADAIIRAIRDIDPSLAIYTLPRSTMVDVCSDHSMRCVAEAFMDRTYHINGQLTSRDRPDAIIDDPEQAWHQASSIWHDHKVHTVDGEDLTLEADTICIHGDHPRTMEILQYEHL